MRHEDLERWFDELLAEYGPALNRLAASYTRASNEREDLLQEIVFAIWRALPGFRREASARTFLFRIAHNRAITHVAQRRPAAIQAPLDDEDLQLAAASPDPEQAFSTRQDGERLLDAIRGLPMAYAQVITLALEGMSYAEVADVLGISESNVGARLTRAREMLRSQLRSGDERR